MSRIDELIQEECPNGVEFRHLSELCDIQNGFAFSSEFFNTEGRGTPLIRIRDINTGFSGTFFSGGFDSKYLVEPGDIVIGMDGAFQAIRWPHERALLNQRTCRLQNFRPEINPQFVFHALNPVLHKINGATEQSTVKHLSTKQLGQTPFPVPPMPVQEEIVRILDTFTELEAQLEAELEARQVQFEFMRDQFLRASPFQQAEIQDWQKFALKELANRISDGSHNPPKGSIGGEYPMISAKNVSGGEIDFEDARMLDFDDFEKEDRRTQVKPGCVLLTIVGAIGRVAVVDTTQPMVFQRSICVIEPKSELLRPEFLKYALESSRMQQNILSGAAGAAQKGLYLNQVANLSIALPDLKTQDEIISNLKPLDELVRNISVGLPAEINARRKQYEYYRDKLLTFEELVA